MTECPCGTHHIWMIDDYFNYTGECAVCDCCFKCKDCHERRPAPGLIHQCTADPKGSNF